MVLPFGTSPVIVCAQLPLPATVHCNVTVVVPPAELIVLIVLFGRMMPSLTEGEPTAIPVMMLAGNELVANFRTSVLAGASAVVAMLPGIVISAAGIATT